MRAAAGGPRLEDHHSLDSGLDPSIQVGETLRAFGASLHIAEVLGDVLDRLQAAGCRLLGLQVVPSQPADMTIDTQRQMWQRDGQDARTDAQARPRVLIPFRSFTSCSVIASLPSVGHSLTEAADLEASTVDRTGEQPCGLRVRWAQRRHEPRKGSVSV